MDILQQILEFFVHPLTSGIMQRGMLVLVPISIVCALLSCWLVLIGWSLMGDAISHAVLPGVVIAYTLKLPFALGAIVCAFIAVALIGTVKETTRVKEDAAIGIVFSGMLALGLVLLAKNPTHIDLHRIIFGSLTGVLVSDVPQVLVIAGIVLVVLILKRRDLMLYAFDKTHAHSIGLKPKILGAILLGVLALTSVITFQIVGTILVVAMLIIPGATAYLLTDKFSKMLIIAPALALSMSIIGFYLSYWLDLRSGSAIVLIQAIVYWLVYLFSPKHGILGKRIALIKRAKSTR